MIEYFKKLSKYKERTALIDGENNVSYDEIIKSSKNLNEKICENSVSLLIADNNVNFIKGYIGFLNKKKNISILIDESFNKDFFGKVISIYRPKYIFLPFNAPVPSLIYLSPCGWDFCCTTDPFLSIFSSLLISYFNFNFWIYRSSISSPLFFSINCYFYNMFYGKF
jgi:hypothetical protein